VINASIPTFLFAQLYYPPAMREDIEETFFGKVISDPYRYLEKQEDQARTFLYAQDEFFKRQSATIDHQPFFYKALLSKSYANLKRRIKQGKYYFRFYIRDYLDYYNYAPSLYCFNSLEDNIPGLAVQPKIFKMSEEDVAAIHDFKISNDSRLLAVSLSHSGSDWREIRVIDMKTTKPLPDQIKWSRFGSIYWSNDGFFYCRYDEPAPGRELNAIKNKRLYYHVLDTKQEDDKLIYEIPESAYRDFHYEISSDQSTLFMFTKIVVNNVSHNAVLTKDLSDPKGNFHELLVWPGTSKTFYKLVHKEGNSVYMISNREDYNNTILEFDITTKNKGTTITELAKERLVEAKVVDRKIICVYSTNFKSAIAIYDLKGNLLNHWKLPEGAAIQDLHADVDDTKLIYSFETYYAPASFYVIDLRTFERKPLSYTGVLYRFEDVVTDYVEYPSKDGTLIPMFLTYNKKKLRKDGTNPCLLIGPGGLGEVVTPQFDPSFPIIFEHGGVLAVPCVRGGGQSEHWHEAAMKLNKQKAIDDYIAAAEYLIKEKYTSSPKLAANGVSHGGLLVTAAMLQRPELFGIVIGEVGIYDMLRYQFYGGAYQWRDEYGLRTDSIEFNNLLSYSPLHNVKEGVDYPALLLTTAVNDDHIPSLHSYKFIATMQRLGGKKNPYLLFMQLKAGHQGSDVRDNELKKDALKLGFLFKYWGIKKLVTRT
jgi:prolyl oligopeptidase